MLRSMLVFALVIVLWGSMAAALPTPGLNGETTEAVPVVGRLFPEALHTNDYIGYFEAVASFEKLAAEYPDVIELHRVGKSYGWMSALSGAREPHDVFVIDVTNEASEVALEDKIHLVFACSVHGNEKGGREGCMRVAEDFAKGIGMAQEHPGLVDLLDYMAVVLVFTNTDGWTHDEPEYYAANPSTFYSRGNANGSDLNRQWPTIGYLETSQSHKTLAEPEIAAIAPFLRDRYPNVWYAIDIHGMLNPADGGGPPPLPTNCLPANPTSCPESATEFQEWFEDTEKGHFVLGLLASQQLTQDEFLRQTRMAELIRERTNDCPGTLGPAWCVAPSTGAWGGAYNYWGTSWETIGYTSTGTTSMFMMNPFGLDAPAASYEMAYNHIVCDGVYIGCGQYMNEFHVNNVRRMVQALMEAASTDFRVSYEAGDARTAFISNPKVLTTADASGNPRPADGWADENPLDDRWDIMHNVYVATPMDYLRDLAGHVRSGDRPAVFDELPVSSVDAEHLSRYDRLIVAGSTAEALSDAEVEAVKAWVEAGGALVLTDQSMLLMERMAVVAEGSVESSLHYVGQTEVVDYSHPLAKDLIGYSRQTYDPPTVGYPQGSAPVWAVDPEAIEGRGSIVGVVPASGPVPQGGGEVNLGEVGFGQGSIRFLGALLPDPMAEQYTPYGVGSYGVTYAGNQFFVNLLGFDQVFEAPPVAFEDVGSLRKARPATPGEVSSGEDVDAGQGGKSPGFGAVASVVTLVAAGVLAASRRLRD